MSAREPLLLDAGSRSKGPGGRSLVGVDEVAARVAALPSVPRVIALIPAWNEEETIPLALTSLSRQSRTLDLVIVIADNCTDGTAAVAGATEGAIVVETRDNRHKKAGALNQVLEQVLPAMDAADAILVMDADSVLDPEFVEAALARLGTRTGGQHSKLIGGVGGTFSGGRGGGLVGMFQRNEYTRYARDVRRLKGKVLVLTGTASLFRVDVLRHVVAARRSGQLPGTRAQVYDTNVLTEDNELTLALLHLGYAIRSPRECLLETEVMVTWRKLWLQRVRWKRGALENLLDYGLTRITARYWGRQVLTHVGVVVTAVYLGSIVWSLWVDGAIHLHAIWLAVTVIFMLERAITVRARGPWQVLLGFVLVIEMPFDFFLQAAQAKALWDTITSKERNW